MKVKTSRKAGSQYSTPPPVLWENLSLKEKYNEHLRHKQNLWAQENERRRTDSINQLYGKNVDLGRAFAEWCFDTFGIEAGYERLADTDKVRVTWNFVHGMWADCSPADM